MLVSNLECMIKPTDGAADQQLTVDNTVQEFAAFDHEKTRFVVVTVDTAAVRVTFDGSDPTATDGHVLPAGYEAVWSRQRAQAAKFIRDTGSDGYVQGSEMTI